MSAKKIECATNYYRKQNISPRRDLLNLDTSHGKTTVNRSSFVSINCNQMLNWIKPNLATNRQSALTSVRWNDHSHRTTVAMQTTKTTTIATMEIWRHQIFIIKWFREYNWNSVVYHLCGGIFVVCFPFIAICNDIVRDSLLSLYWIRVNVYLKLFADILWCSNVYKIIQTKQRL